MRAMPSSGSPARARSASAAEPPPGRPNLILAIIVCCQLMIVVATTVTGIALPGIKRDLGFSPTGLSWVVNAYMLAFGGLLLLGGRAGDILGRRRVFLAGIALFTAGSLLAALAPSAPVLLAALAVEGVGAALADPTSLALLTATFAQGAPRNRALAVSAMVAGVGTAVGLLLGGLLAAASWRWAMGLNVPCGAAVLAATPFFVPESERRPARFDLAGALTSTAGMAAVVNAFIRAQAHGWSDRYSIGSLAAAAVLLTAFVAIEARAVQPIVPLHLFARAQRRYGFADIFLVGATVSGLFFFPTQFLETARGFSTLRTGAAYLPLAVAMVATAWAAPRLLARVSARPLLVAGALTLGAGTLWFTDLSADTAYLAGVVGPLVLVGVGLGLTIMPLTALILADTPSEEVGAASGLQQAMLRIGGSLGLAVMVTTGASSGAATKAHPVAALLHSVTTAFTIASVVVGAVLVLGFAAFHRASADARATPARTAPVAPD